MNDQMKKNKGSRGDQIIPPERPDGLLTQNRLNLKPVHMLAITIVGIFLAEVVAMSIIPSLAEMDYVWLVLVDALIMTIIVFPVLYFLSFKPLLAYLRQSELAVAELQALQLGLEQRVEQRTADLSQANQSLSTEIAERMQTEKLLEQNRQELKRTHDMLEAVTKGTEVIIATVDKNFCYTYFNEAYQEEIKRLSGKDIQIGASMVDTFGHLPEQQKIILEEWSLVLQGESTHKVLPFGDPDVFRRTYNVLHTPIRDAEGDLVGAGEVAYDITERVRTQEALQESEERYRSLFAAMTEGFAIHEIILDDSGEPCDYRFLDINPAFERLTGLKREAVVGRTYRTILPNEGDSWVKTYGNVVLTGEPVQFENYSPTLNKHYEVVAYRCAPNQFAVIFLDITELKKMEAELRINLAKYSALFTSLPIGVTVSDQNGQIIESNPEANRLLDLSEAEHQGRQIDGEQWKIVRTDRTPMPPEEFASVRAMKEQRRIENLEMGIVKREDEITWISVTAAPLPLEGYGVIIAYNDINRRKQAESALRQAHDELELRVQQRTEELALANEKLLRANAVLVAEIAERERVMAQLRLTSAALEAAANGIFITNREGNINWINPAFSKLTGYTDSEAIGRNPRLLKSGKHSQEYYQQMWDTILSGQVWRAEITNQRKDGSTYVEDQTITPILDAEGRINNFIVIQQDITERIRAEQELIQTNQLLERYFSSIDTLIAYMDRDFNFIRVNEAYAKSAGYTADHFLGKNHFGLYPHAENQVIFQRVVDTGEPYVVFEKPFEYPDHPDWGVTYWDWSLQPVKRPDGLVEGLVLSLVDVTGRKRAEIELARQNQELLALSKVEHELREFAESLTQSTISLNSTLEQEQVLASILEQIHRAIPFTVGDIILKEGRSYRIAGILNTREMDEAWPPADISYSLDDFPLLDQLFTTLQPLLISEADGTAGWQHLTGLEWVRSYVGAPLAASGQVFGVINLHSDQPGAFDQRTVAKLMAYTAPAATAMQNAWLFDQVRSSREHLQALSRRLVEIQEGERRYIASELHDEVGQALTGLTLGLQLVERRAGDPQAVRAEVSEMNRMLESVLEDLHRLAMDLRPASLDHLGLAAALRQHMAMVNDKYGLVAQFEMVGIQERLPDELEIAFYRIVQEALNNVVRHARAKHVDVVFDRRPDSLLLIIEDDGVGFDPQTTLEKRERLGLFGMRERAEMLGGKMIIESTPGKGTTLLVEVPYGNTHLDR